MNIFVVLLFAASLLASIVAMYREKTLTSVAVLLAVITMLVAYLIGGRS